MREFKFRAWDKELKKMVYEDDEECLIGYDGTELFLTRDVYWGEEIQTEIAEDVIFMEWTGIRDSKGQKIYEGDVVEFKPWNKECGENYVIVYVPDDASFRGIKQKLNSTKVISLINSEQGLKVIGNVYEDEGLLKKEEE